MTDYTYEKSAELLKDLTVVKSGGKYGNRRARSKRKKGVSRKKSAKNETSLLDVEEFDAHYRNMLKGPFRLIQVMIAVCRDYDLNEYIGTGIC